MEMVAMAGQVLAEAVGGRAVTKKAASTRANSIKMESVLTEFALVFSPARHAPETRSIPRHQGDARQTLAVPRPIA